MSTLLDRMFPSSQDDPRYGANMALFANLIAGNFPQGLLAHGQLLSQGKKDQQDALLAQAQLKNYEGQDAERQEKIAQARAAREQEAAIQAKLPSLFRQPGFTGGQAVPQEVGGVPMFSQPMNVAPMQATPGGFDMQSALLAGMKPERATAYANALTHGRPKVARTVKGLGPDGREYEYQVDESGNKLGESFPQFRAPLQVGQGDRTAFLDPYSLGVKGTLPINQSADSRAATAVSWANHGLNKQRLALEQGNAVAEGGGPSQVGLVKQFGKAEPGRRWKPDGSQEPIPGGSADLKAGEQGERTRRRQDAQIAQADSVLKEIRDAKGLVGWNTAGVGGLTQIVPSSDGRDLAAKLQTIKANLGFDRLQQMREESPTGGALGQVAVQELAALQSTVASLDQLQSAGQLGAGLDKAERHYTNWRNAVDEARKGSTGGASGGWSIQEKK